MARTINSMPYDLESPLNAESVVPNTRALNRFQNMQEFLNLPSSEQDRLTQNYGIPADSTNNQFKAWVQHAREVNRDLVIAIKADQQTPYPKIKNIMNTLQDLRENRYNLITTLKNVPDNI